MTGTNPSTRTSRAIAIALDQVFGARPSWDDPFNPQLVDQETGAEINRRINHLARALYPSRKPDVLAALGDLKQAIYPVNSIDSMRISRLAEALALYPIQAIRSACTEWGNTSRFWPAAAELLKLTEAKQKPMVDQLAQLRKLHAIIETHHNPDPHLRSAQDALERIRRDHRDDPDYDADRAMKLLNLVDTVKRLTDQQTRRLSR